MSGEGESGRLGPVRYVFTDRRGGFSEPPWDALNLADHVGDDPGAVARNRAAAAALLGHRGQDVAVISAVHGARVAVADGPGTYPDSDAVMTGERGVVLMALAADCIPAVVADTRRGTAAVVHSGWRGVCANIAGAVVDELVVRGGKSEDLTAVLGPCICARCFEVGPDVAELVAAAVPGMAGRTPWGAHSVDLAAAMERQFRNAGVAVVRRIQRCTFEDRRLYSYRRDGTTGRHGVLAVLEGGGDCG